MRVFWFLLLTMVVVVAAVTLAVVGGGKNAVLQDVAAERLTDPLPVTRPVGRADIEALRLPVALRGYRMMDVDEALDRLGAELAERDARIAELESVLAGAQATAVGGPGLLAEPADGPHPAPERSKDESRLARERPEDGADGAHPALGRSEDQSRTPWDTSWHDDSLADVSQGAWDAPRQHGPGPRGSHEPQQRDRRPYEPGPYEPRRAEDTGEEPRR